MSSLTFQTRSAIRAHVIEINSGKLVALPFDRRKALTAAVRRQQGAGKMRTESILKKAVAGLGSAALVIAMSACAHHDVAADQGYGQIRTEAPATADSSEDHGRNSSRAGQHGRRRHRADSGRDLRPGGGRQQRPRLHQQFCRRHRQRLRDRHEHEREPDPEEQQQLECDGHAVAGHGRDHDETTVITPAPAPVDRRDARARLR